MTRRAPHADEATASAGNGRADRRRGLRAETRLGRVGQHSRVEETQTMSFITGKHMPRRTFLRGVGATVALPFLDAMVPAGRVFAKTASADRTRLVCIEEVHGLPGCNNWGATKFLFGPEQTGPNFTLVPDKPLSTLAAYRE